MRRTICLLAMAICSLALSGCTPADPKDVPKSAQEVVDNLKERKYAAMYDDASSDFRDANPKDEFMKKMAELEAFGQLVEATPEGEPSVSADGDARVAVVTYGTKFALAEGPFTVSLRGNDMTGEWELDHYEYDITATTFDPPYAPNEDGAEKLARRFLYLWQNRRYDDLPTTMKLEEDPEKIATFLKKLENAGQLLTMTRKRYEPYSKGRERRALSDYDLKFDNGTGTMNFELVEDGGEWRIETVKYEIEYFTSGAPPVTQPTQR